MILTEEELHRAAQVHYSFLPQHYSNGVVDIAVKTRPLNALGGDYCSIYPIEKDCVLVCMCDAVGHNVASALFASRINTFVLTHALQKHCPCHMIESLNEHLCQRMSTTGMFTTFFSVFINTQKKDFFYAGAGHPAALHYHNQTGQCEPLESVTTMLGISHPLLLGCTVAHKSFHIGDKIVLYTDGLIESRDATGAEFGQDRLVRFTQHQYQLESAKFNDLLFKTLRCDHGSEIKDDILLLTITMI